LITLNDLLKQRLLVTESGVQARFCKPRRFQQIRQTRALVAVLPKSDERDSNTVSSSNLRGRAVGAAAELTHLPRLH
jgi:hypothetical protein